jgi:hypothetical protein
LLGFSPSGEVATPTITAPNATTHAELNADAAALRSHVEKELEKALAGKRGRARQLFEKEAGAIALAQAKLALTEAFKTAVQNELKKAVADAKAKELGDFEKVTADEVIAAAVASLKQ